jgi:hypothetical protein
LYVSVEVGGEGAGYLCVRHETQMRHAHQMISKLSSSEEQPFCAAAAPIVDFDFEENYLQPGIIPSASNFAKAEVKIDDRLVEIGKRWRSRYCSNSSGS